MTTTKLLSTMSPLEGILSIYTSKPGQEKTLVFQEKNVITRASKLKILRTLIPDVSVADPIVGLRVGIGGSIDPEGLYPKPINGELSTLFNEILAVDTSYVENEAIPSVTFLADIHQAEGNGELLNEVGLFHQSGDMFNIKTFPAIAKTAEFNIHFEWTIKIV